jgi:hypothetical protein
MHDMLHWVADDVEHGAVHELPPHVEPAQRDEQSVF